MTQIYKVGTATVTNGSTTVEGTDTGWATALVTGGLFTRNGLSVPIESVTDEDTLVLALAWPGPTSTGAYSILRENSAAASVVDLYDRLRQATITLSLHSIHPDFVGTLAQIEALDLTPEDTEFVAARLEDGQPDEYYRWGGTDWVGPFPIRGNDGEDSNVPGPPGPGLTPAGEWDTETVYATGAYVQHGSRTFASKIDDNEGNEPPSADEDDSNWMWVPAVAGAQGDPGNDGGSAYVYIAYASADDGTGFTLTFDAGLDYIAILATDTAIETPAAGDFAGLWKNYKGTQGDPGTPGDPGEPGTPGEPGEDGADGALWYAGSSDPDDGNGADGDFYLQTGTGSTGVLGDVWEKQSGSWVKVSNIRGASGEGTGDVVGPDGGVSDGHAVLFDTTTGKLIKSAGFAPASATQGSKADTAVQPGDLAAVATSGDYDDLSNAPSLGTAAAKDVGTSAGNVPELDGAGKLDSAVIPAVAITDVFVVANQSAMLALTAEKGDIAIRTDLNKSFALQTNSPTTLADWKELLTPTDAVLSVAGLTGAISGSALKTALSLVKADVGLGNVDNTSNATERAAAATLTNKRITKRIGTTASSSAPTPSADSHDQYNVTALAAGATFGAPSGTPTDGQKMIIRVKDNGTARSLGYNAIYRAIGVTLPTTTVIGKTLYLGMIYNAADSKWDVVAVGVEA